MNDITVAAPEASEALEPIEIAPEPEAAAPEPEVAAPEPEVAAPEPEAAAPEAEAAAPAPAAGAPTKPEVAQRGRPRLKLEDLTVGTEMKGKVMRTADFGAFVDIGAVTDGLVHVTELSDRRVNKVDDVVKSGDSVDVWIKEIDVKKGRISLSMKRRPTRSLDALKAGEPITGHVKSLTTYGAFVDIGAETDGLVHVSEMGSGFTQSPSEVVKVGAEVEVWVKEVDAKAKRISLTMKDPASQAPSASRSRSRNEPAKQEMPEEPAGPPQPTMMELALRKALGESDEADETAPDGTPTTAPASTDSLGQVYARMLEEYRAQRGND